MKQWQPYLLESRKRVHAINLHSNFPEMALFAALNCFKEDQVKTKVKDAINKIKIIAVRGEHEIKYSRE